MTALDTNVLLDVLDSDARFAPAVVRTLDALGEGLVIAPIVYAELCARPGWEPKDVNPFLHSAGIGVDWSLDAEIWSHVGSAFAEYARRRRRSRRGAEPRRLTRNASARFSPATRRSTAERSPNSRSSNRTNVVRPHELLLMERRATPLDVLEACRRLWRPSGDIVRDCPFEIGGVVEAAAANALAGRIAEESRGARPALPLGAIGALTGCSLRSCDDQTE